MQNAKIVLFIVLIVLAGGSAHAGDWRLMATRAGFYGQYSLGLSYEWNPRHAVDYSIGTYQIDLENYYQSNLGYRYSHWQIPFYGNDWRPLQFGAFLVYAMNQQRYFLKSPGKYPYPEYYDETALRYGLEFSSTITFKPSRIGLGYHFRIFDNGVIATFNNSARNLQYYSSSGISVQYLF